MKPTDTMTAAEYMRLVETANNRRADAHRKGHPIPIKSLEGQAAKTTPPESRSHKK